MRILAMALVLMASVALAGDERAKARDAINKAIKNLELEREAINKAIKNLEERKRQIEEVLPPPIGIPDKVTPSDKVTAPSNLSIKGRIEWWGKTWQPPVPKTTAPPSNLSIRERIEWWEKNYPNLGKE